MKLALFSSDYYILCNILCMSCWILVWDDVRFSLRFLKPQIAAPYWHAKSIETESRYVRTYT